MDPDSPREAKPIPLYHNRCGSCTHDFEQAQGIREDPLSVCPACGRSALRRVCYPPIVLDATPKTLGGFAERNTDTMGGYALDKLQHERKEWVRGVRPDQPDGPPPRDEALYERPDYLPADAAGPSLGLLSLTPQQQSSYIETGNPNG